MTAKRNFVLWLAAIYAVSCLLHPALAAAAGSPVARVSDKKGQATVTRAAATTPLAIQAPLFLKDVVRTQASSRAKLLFVDNTLLTIAPETKLVIEKYLFDPAKKVQRGLVRLTAGAIKVTTSQLMGLKDRRFQIKTTTATVGLRGTEVIVITGRGKPPAGLGTPPTRQSRRAGPVRVAMLGPLTPLGPIVVAQLGDPWTFIYNASMTMALVYIMLNSNTAQTIALAPGFFVWVMAGFIGPVVQLNPTLAMWLGTLFLMAFNVHLLQIMNRFGQPFIPGSRLYYQGSSGSEGSSGHKGRQSP